jgi:glycosyltransferase involved in cell wall biosynthesis
MIKNKNMNFNSPISFHDRKTVGDKKFSILIPSWNNLGLLKICIAGIEKNSTHQHQIIIHINEGIDGTLDWVKNNNYDYTYSAENVGVCNAMNAMRELVKTNYIVYINDDMYVCPDWDKYLINAIDAHQGDYFYFSSTVIEPKKTANKCVLSPHDFGTTALNFKEEELLAFAKNVTFKDWYGASWPPSIVHKNVWDLVGGYSTAFSPGFGSDPDFSMKLWQLGVREFKGIGKSLAYHFKSKTTGRVIANNGRLQFAKKWGIPISYFYRDVLKLGLTYKGETLKLTKNISYLYAKIRAFWIVLKER